MPNRLIPVLSISCGALTALYVVLVVTTVFFATWQTQASSSVRDSESAIGNLEAKYYTTMNHLSAVDPSSMGYVAPTEVEYVAAVRNTSALTFAGK